MSAIISLILCAVGIVLLFYGSNLLIDHATKLAKNIGIPLLLIGFTIIALGTSLPELIVGIFAGIANENDLVLGNILGSNMANLGLALGIAAIIFPVGHEARKNSVQLYSMIIAISLLYLLIRDGNLDRFDGTILVCFGIIFTLLNIVHAQKTNNLGQIFEKLITVQHRRRRIINILAMMAGLLLLFIGARMTVNNAVSLAKIFHISEVLIGITILAVGTSLPEIMTAITASRKKSNSLSVGNIIGSNVLNIFMVLGVTVLIHPITVKPTVWRFDLPFLLIMSIVVVTFIKSGRELSKLEGLLLISAYITYIGLAFFLRI